MVRKSQLGPIVSTPKSQSAKFSPAGALLGSAPKTLALSSPELHEEFNVAVICNLMYIANDGVEVRTNGRRRDNI